MLLRILRQGGVNTRVLGIFFNAVVQAMLLFGLEMWVITPHMGRDMEGFHQRVACRITQRQPWCLQEISWE